MTLQEFEDSITIDDIREVLLQAMQLPKQIEVLNSNIIN